MNNIQKKYYFPTVNDDSWTPFRTNKCPKCGNFWFGRYFYYDNHKDEIISEYRGFERQIIKNQIEKIYTEIFKCKNCRNYISEKHTYITEESIIIDSFENNKELIQQFEKLKSEQITISNLKEDDLSDDNLEYLINKSKD